MSLDLRKAIDTVSVPVLVNKLENVGIKGIPLTIYKEYLSNRKQRDQIGQFVSEDKYVL